MNQFGKHLSKLGFTLFILLWAEVAFASAELSSMRVGQTDDKTRVVFDLKDSKDYKVFQLNNPSRIVVDFFDTDNALSFKNKILTDKRLFKIRVADKEKRVRVVLDLHKNPHYQVFMLAGNESKGQRLVVDLLAKPLATKIEKASPAKAQVASTNKDSNISQAKANQRDNKVADKPKQANNAQLAQQPTSKPSSANAVSAHKSAQLEKIIQQAMSDKTEPALIVESFADQIEVNKKPATTKTEQKPTQAQHSLLPQANHKQPLVALAPKTSEKTLPASKATESLLDQESAVLQKPADLVIAIDAGHGGKDTGAIGHNRVYEKHATLAMAKQLKAYIDKQPGMKAILTREKDEFIRLSERVKIAKQKQADIFISIHADAFHDSSVRGGSVYVLSERGASSTMARLLAKSENSAIDDIHLNGMDDDLAFALSDLSREANIRASHKLAKVVLGEMHKTIKMHKHSVQSAGFAVLKSIDMPSLLIETAFISNPHEARNLMSRGFQRKMAASIVDGLVKYRDELYPQQRWGDTLYVHYKVQYGDTLSQIAANYNVTTKQLKHVNNIKNANQLYVGKKLKIPVSKEVLAGL
ncbi:N-acetylmuramoyl-L-alanine amidase [Thiomicrorhabdus sediminis]|uniref:N-acetylmuramoyl-L-alanine amidase n=1 Tax=Thiomicrorhabdus sediminis TaxID=2580412 RepID=A0A4P9K511_9GAMM|nr:N-acetylmuramoyl-L-alanine amidase [Thiomicrorhabdus sediminis]QCU89851.1 AMIN domain-containing protein [Thiomicrorhabdus sediminis]